MVRQIVVVSELHRYTGTPLQPVFYGSRLLYAAGAFGVDCHVELVGVSLKEGV